LSNIVEIKLKDKNDLKANLEILKRSMPELKEHIKLTAEMRKASYDSHIETGFTPEQALELCKQLSI